MPERVISFAQAIAEAVEGIMEEDPRFQLMGARFTGHTKSARVMDPIMERYADRISWPPISELAYCGMAIGAAMTGVRSIVEMSTATFSYEAIPQIVNEAAIIHANSNGRVCAPVVFHVLYGIRGAGVAAVLAGLIADEMFTSLRAPVKRVGVLPVPVPYAKPMEDHVTPRVDRLVRAAREVTGR